MIHSYWVTEFDIVTDNMITDLWTVSKQKNNAEGKGYRSTQLTLLLIVSRSHFNLGDAPCTFCADVLVKCTTISGKFRSNRIVAIAVSLGLSIDCLEDARWQRRIYEIWLSLFSMFAVFLLGQRRQGLNLLNWSDSGFYLQDIIDQYLGSILHHWLHLINTEIFSVQFWNFVK
jgi:hypothetical protein